MVYRRSKDPAHSCLIRSAATSYRTRTFDESDRIVAADGIMVGAVFFRRPCTSPLQHHVAVAVWIWSSLATLPVFRSAIFRRRIDFAPSQIDLRRSSYELRVSHERRNITLAPGRWRFSCCCTHGSRKFRFHVDRGKRQTIAADSGLCIVRSMEVTDPAGLVMSAPWTWWTRLLPRRVEKADPKGSPAAAPSTSPCSLHLPGTLASSTAMFRTTGKHCASTGQGRWCYNWIFQWSLYSLQVYNKQHWEIVHEKEASMPR
jgi:hypothetical protein